MSGTDGLGAEEVSGELGVCGVSLGESGSPGTPGVPVPEEGSSGPPGSAEDAESTGDDAEAEGSSGFPLQPDRQQQTSSAASRQANAFFMVTDPFVRHDQPYVQWFFLSGGIAVFTASSGIYLTMPDR